MSRRIFRPHRQVIVSGKADRVGFLDASVRSVAVISPVRSAKPANSLRNTDLTDNTGAMRYPVKAAGDWHCVGKLSSLDRLALAFRNLRYRRRGRKFGPVPLSAARRLAAPLNPSDIVLICVTRNAQKYLPSFLAHYRRLGVARFAFVDDHSDDATRALLLAAPDVDVYESTADFRQSNGGLIWRDMLVDLYGRDRWYVSIDSDEYLVYPGAETRPLSAFVADLERRGFKRGLAAMIDIYPDASLDQTPPHQPPEAFPTTICPLFDGDTYRIGNENFCTAVRGGPRFRLFGTDMRLTKFPLLFADAGTRFSGGSHHGPLPVTRNFSAVQSVLLHYKFDASAVADFRTIVERASHAGNSRFYKQIVGHDGFHAGIDLRYPGSIAYNGSEALVSAGFMQDLRV